MRRSLLVFASALGLFTAACGRGELPKLPGQAASANGEQAMAAGVADMSMVANVEYRLADGVTIDVDKAKAYRFGKVDEADVKKLADALGVSGPIKNDQYGFTVGADGAGKNLYVGKEGTFSMSAVSPNTAVGSCASDQPDCGVDVAPTPPPATDAAKTQARAKAEALFEKVGIDVDGAAVDVSGDSANITVSFKPSLDGKAVDGYELFATVGADGAITSASGQATKPGEAGTYGLATLKRAVERLNEQNGQYRTLEATIDPAVSDAATDMAADDTSGGGATGEPMVITLTKVTAGLMIQSDADNQMWLVPAYLFESEDGGRVVAQAADDKYIAKPQTATSVPVDSGATEPAPAANCTPIDGNSGISGQVCASATTVKAGEEVRFSIDMGDDNRNFEEGCANGVSTDFGDGGAGQVQCMACQTDMADGPGKAHREAAHVYEKAGNYTATFTLKSGLSCGPANPNDSTATVRIPITVA